MNRSVVSREPVCNGVGIFAVNRAAGFAINKFNAFVVPGFDAFDEVGAIHDVGFEENDGALIEASGEKIARPEIWVAVEIGRKLMVGSVGVGREVGVIFERCGDARGERDFFFDVAREKALEHFKAFVVVGEFAFMKGAGQDDVKVLSGCGEG